MTDGETCLLIILLVTLMHLYTAKKVNKLFDLTSANAESIVRLNQVVEKSLSTAKKTK